ncbi:MAG: 7-carboxy-7-deazaguanine synthase QueE [Gammaproteobacteria bacterium]|nr:7-carboxy-7-deazaguanine synthase QueE [Gammaproteobacteria bacterium]
MSALIDDHGPVQEKRLAQTLRVNEIFLSIQGESARVGLPTAFVRLTGCPLRCSYCDTAYAFHEGTSMSIAVILDAVSAYGTRYVTVTGGEPLAQKPCLDLLSSLCDRDYQVSLETGGALDVSPVDRRVMKILDIKTPASGEVGSNRHENLKHLAPPDQIKFVICDRADYDWAKARVLDEKLDRLCEVLFSPSHDELAAATLADWILEDRLPVRLQVQLHKYLWGNVRGR